MNVQLKCKIKYSFEIWQELLVGVLGVAEQVIQVFTQECLATCHGWGQISMDAFAEAKQNINHPMDGGKLTETGKYTKKKKTNKEN